MQLTTFKKYFQAELQGLYDKDEIHSFYVMLLSHQLNLEYVDLVLNPTLDISSNDELFLREVAEKLKLEIPIQYILGETEFYGLTFKVDENTLIPRPETEELVSWILENYKNTAKEFNVLDIGTGSGCIPISLAKNILSSKVTSVDISEKAIQIATQNAQNIGVSVDFICSSALDTIQLSSDLNHQKWEVIVSNPPYVRELEKQEIKKNVLQYEPHLALFVADDDALIFYRKIGTYAFKNLTENGQLFFEINQYLGAETVVLLHQIGFKTVELRKDFSGNDRMIRAARN